MRLVIKSNGYVIFHMTELQILNALGYRKGFDFGLKPGTEIEVCAENSRGVSVVDFVTVPQPTEE